MRPRQPSARPRPQTAEQESSPLVTPLRIILVVLVLGGLWLAHAGKTGQLDSILSRLKDATSTVFAPARNDVASPSSPRQAPSAAAPLLSEEEIELALMPPDMLFAQGEYHDIRDLATAAKYYRKAAELGHVEAQGRMGVIHAEGDGVPKDMAQALKWFRKAGAQGDVTSCFWLGHLYYTGEGVPQDMAQAAFWYRKAAEQGHAGACFNLGIRYYRGEGVRQDKAQALEWFRKAAELGHDRGQYNVGYMYYHGDGVPQDKAQGLEWFRKAAGQRVPEACYTLGLMYYEGDGVARDIHMAAHWLQTAGSCEAAVRMRQQEDIRKAGEENKETSYYQRFAYEDLARRAREGEAQAQFELGKAYEKGRKAWPKLPRDTTQAVEWYRKAAEQGHLDALLHLAEMYHNGEGVPQNEAEAAVWYRRAGELGNVRALKRLAEMYRTGDGIPRDMAQAIHWYRKVAEQGDDDDACNAWKRLGDIHAKGDGVPRDMAQAAICRREAAWLGDEDVPSLQARMYAEGDGVPRDMGRAALWYGWAARQASLWSDNWYGDDHAMLELGRMYAEGDGLPRNTSLAAAWYYLCQKRSSGDRYREARDALKALGMPSATLDPHEKRIMTLLKAHVMMDRFDLMRDADARNKDRLAAFYEEAIRQTARLMTERQKLNPEGDAVPPGVADMFAALYARAVNVHREALVALGRLCIAGDGIPKDVGKGLACYRRAAGLGDSRARDLLKELIPDIVPAPTASAPADAKATAAGGPEGTTRQADEDTAAARLARGRACWNGDGVPRDRTQAVAHFRTALELGSAEAARLLARCCFFGEGTAQDDAETLYHLLMYEALRDREMPLPETEAALKRCCGLLLSPDAISMAVWRRDKALKDRQPPDEPRSDARNAP